MSKMVVAILVLMLANISFAYADSWPGAEEAGVASPDGRIVVRIIPGESLGEVHGFSGTKKGKHAI